MEEDPWCGSRVIFFNPGTGSQIVFSLLISLASMRVYAKYSPFIQVRVL